MRIWLVTVGEPLPMDGQNVRLLRTAQFAEWLGMNSHEVVFWTGTMDHAGRRLRSPYTTTTQMSPNYRIVQLAGRLYKRAVSVQRILNHREVAREFSRQAVNFEQPDIVLCSFPTQELCQSVLDYAEPREIPVVLDVRDLWPDIFADVIPRPLRFLAPMLLAPFERPTAAVFSRAAAITGPAKSMIEWGLAKGKRSASGLDFWFPFTYPRQDLAVAEDSLPGFMAGADAADRTWFCFFGALSPRYNLEMVIDCFRLLGRENVKASVVICGTGDARDALMTRAQDLDNVHLPGWMDLSQIKAIMSRSQAGIFPYNTPDYFRNLPNKICEYLAGGLPILSCTEGEVKNLISETGCGFWHVSDVARMAELIARLVENPQLLAQASLRSKDVYNRFFERDSVFSDALRNLKKIGEGNPEIL